MYVPIWAEAKEPGLEATAEILPYQSDIINSTRVHMLSTLWHNYGYQKRAGSTRSEERSVLNHAS